MSDCKKCDHSEHGRDECEGVVGYDHLNGDHACACSGPVTAISLIRELVDSIEEYPEYVDSELLVTDQYGKEYVLQGTQIQGDVWLIVDNDATDDMAAHADADRFEKQLADIRKLCEVAEGQLAVVPTRALLEILNRKDEKE
jgi:hypothetical protein